MDSEIQILNDAIDSLMAALAVAEEARSVGSPTRNMIDVTQRHTSAANAKLMELQCRQRMGKVGV